MNLIRTVHDSTSKYLAKVTKAQRKKIGQFFTPDEIAEFMGEMSTISMQQVRILDAGAGCGILTAALIEKLRKNKNLKVLKVDLYENDETILPLLKQNMEHIKKQLAKENISFTYRVKEENFILDNAARWGSETTKGIYDIVISNPPYKKIGKKSDEAVLMKEVVYGQPNLYFLFMAMAAKMLKKKGELIFIVPRSFSSGLYFLKFRKWFLKHIKLKAIHLFNSREDIFKCDPILQETVIIKGVKQESQPNYIAVSQCSNTSDLKNTTIFNAPYKDCLRQDENSFLFIPTCEEDVNNLRFVNMWKYSLSKIGYKMKTGVVVDFRAEQWLRTRKTKKTIPLLWSYNFDENKIEFPKYTHGKPQYLLASKDNAALQMKITNYILIKRFTTKEEQKRLQCALLFKDNFMEYESISTENHINFITKLHGEMTKEEMLGLFVVINSITMDKYFRILNGSTQVNANEINSIPFPSFDDILNLGKIAASYKELPDQICEELLQDYFDKKTNKMQLS